MGNPMPGWKAAILDEDDRPVAAGDRGEICLKARSNPHYPLGYWNRSPEDTEEAFGGDWFHTKDAARADEDGYFWYQGRADDVIIRGLPDRPVRGRVGVPRASGCGRGGGGRLTR
jgi:acetyl-CoA synthetase